MKHLILLSISILFLIGFSSHAQNIEKCKCSESFDEIYNYVEQNYPGWKFKVNEKTKKDFYSLTNQVRNKIKTANDLDCSVAIGKWKHFFDDGHLQLTPNFLVKIHEIKKRNVSSFELDKLGKQVNYSSLEGIWAEEEGEYIIAIVKNNETGAEYNYQGVVIKSKNENFKEGLVKFEFSDQDSTGYYITGGLIAGYYKFDFKNEKEFSVGGNTKFIKQNNLNLPSFFPENKQHQIQILDSNTILISFPYLPLNGSDLDSFYSSTKPLLSKYKNLIIDLRGVSGGNSSGWLPFRNYLYTKPIKYESEIAYLTKENSKFWELEKSWVEKIDTNSAFFRTKEIQESFPLEKQKLEIIRSNFGSNKYIELENGEYHQDSVYNYPEKVAIIVDRNCASQAEDICLEAKQSSKVKIFGEPTSGTIDFIIVRERILNCDRFSLNLPIGHRPNLELNALDQTGFIPDVQIPSDIKDWILYVRNNIK